MGCDGRIYQKLKIACEKLKIDFLFIFATA
jgi:hypothetical protein